MQSLHDPIPLALALMAEPSITPQAAGCFDLIERWLTPLGFQVERVTFSGDGGSPTENLYARYGAGTPNLCFAGHVDVVPPGHFDAWRVPPFAPQVEAGVLYGRGAEDMKGAIAAMIAAAARVVTQTPQLQGSLSFLLTADEEGAAINGTRKLLEHLHARAERIDYCVVGEPTNPTYVGEMAKLGRRGSLVCDLKVIGKQGHVAYPHLAENPITRLVAMLHRLKTTPLDNGTSFFDASNLEVTTVDVANPSHNSIPAVAHAAFNIRFNDLWTGESIQAWVREQCAAVGGEHIVQMRVSGESFLCPPGPLSEALCDAVQEVTGHVPALSTTGGTSDARFIKDYCPVIEFGTTGFTPHQVNECVTAVALEQLCAVYMHLAQALVAFPLVTSR